MKQIIKKPSLAAIAFVAGIAMAMPAVAAIQPPKYQIINKFKVPGDGGWDYLAVDSGSGRLYISRGTHVQVMDTTSGQIVGDIANTPGVHGIAIAPKLGKGFTSNGRENTVTVFDLTTLRVLDRIKVGTGPDAIIFDPATNRVFTMNGRSGDATAIDAKTNRVVGTVKLAGRPEYAASDGKGKVYVNIEDKSIIQEVDSRNLRTLRSWPLAPGEGPSGLAIDAKGGYLFSTCDGGVFAVSSIKAGKVVATPKIGDGPDAAAFDPGTGQAFSSNGEGTLTIVVKEGGSFQAFQTLTTQDGARTMALDARHHRIYLIAANYQAAPANGERRRPQMIPGSAVILVAGPARMR